MRLEIAGGRAAPLLHPRLVQVERLAAYPEIIRARLLARATDRTEAQPAFARGPLSAKLALSWRAFFGRGMPPCLPSYRQTMRLSRRSMRRQPRAISRLRAQKSWMSSS